MIVGGRGNRRRNHNSLGLPLAKPGANKFRNKKRQVGDLPRHPILSNSVQSRHTLAAEHHNQPTNSSVLSKSLKAGGTGFNGNSSKSSQKAKKKYDNNRPLNLMTSSPDAYGYGLGFGMTAFGGGGLHDDSSGRDNIGIAMASGGKFSSHDNLLVSKPVSSRSKSGWSNTKPDEFYPAPLSQAEFRARWASHVFTETVEEGQHHHESEEWWSAVRSADIDRIRVLIAKGPNEGGPQDINGLDSRNSKTALYYACMARNIPLMQLLFKHGAEDVFGMAYSVASRQEIINLLDYQRQAKLPKEEQKPSSSKHKIFIGSQTGYEEGNSLHYESKDRPTNEMSNDEDQIVDNLDLYDGTSLPKQIYQSSMVSTIPVMPDKVNVGLATNFGVEPAVRIDPEGQKNKYESHLSAMPRIAKDVLQADNEAQDREKRLSLLVPIEAKQYSEDKMLAEKDHSGKNISGSVGTTQHMGTSDDYIAGTAIISFADSDKLDKFSEIVHNYGHSVADAAAWAFYEMESDTPQLAFTFVCTNAQYLNSNSRGFASLPTESMNLVLSGEWIIFGDASAEVRDMHKSWGDLNLGINVRHCSDFIGWVYKAPFDQDSLLRADVSCIRGVLKFGNKNKLALFHSEFKIILPDLYSEFYTMFLYPISSTELVIMQIFTSDIYAKMSQRIKTNEAFKRVFSIPKSINWVVFGNISNNTHKKMTDFCVDPMLNWKFFFPSHRGGWLHDYELDCQNNRGEAMKKVKIMTEEEKNQEFVVEANEREARNAAAKRTPPHTMAPSVASSALVIPDKRTNIEGENDSRGIGIMRSMRQSIKRAFGLNREASSRSDLMQNRYFWAQGHATFRNKIKRNLYARILRKEGPIIFQAESLIIYEISDTSIGWDIVNTSTRMAESIYNDTDKIIAKLNRLLDSINWIIVGSPESLPRGIFEKLYVKSDVPALKYVIPEEGWILRPHKDLHIDTLITIRGDFCFSDSGTASSFMRALQKNQNLLQHCPSQFLFKTEEKVFSWIISFAQNGIVGGWHFGNRGIIYPEKNRELTMSLEAAVPSLQLAAAILSQSAHVQTLTSHKLCRSGTYPGTNVKRDLVEDHEVSWNIPCNGYRPRTYTAPEISAASHNVDRPSEVRTEYTFNDIDNRIDRTSYNGEYRLEAATGLPLNPFGRTGINGRGLLPRFGPNHEVLVVCTRCRSEPSGMPKIEILSDGSNIPRGRVECGEITPDDFIEIFASQKFPLSSLEDVFLSAKLIYKGYWDDERNTDNAWVEMVVVQFNDDNDGVFASLEPVENAKLSWRTLTPAYFDSLIPTGHPGVRHAFPIELPLSSQGGKTILHAVQEYMDLLL
eukprot:UC4_evm1s1532